MHSYFTGVPNQLPYVCDSMDWTDTYAKSAEMSNLNPNMDKWLNPLWKVGWNNLSIPKHQQFNRWSLGMDK